METRNSTVRIEILVFMRLADKLVINIGNDQIEEGYI
jgi:hypothetical protein